MRIGGSAIVGPGGNAILEPAVAEYPGGECSECGGFAGLIGIKSSALL
jgi:hypothetical protein